MDSTAEQIQKKHSCSTSSKGTLRTSKLDKTETLLTSKSKIQIIPKKDFIDEQTEIAFETKERTSLMINLNFDLKKKNFADFTGDLKPEQTEIQFKTKKTTLLASKLKFDLNRRQKRL